jgi:hypothetical protein
VRGTSGSGNEEEVVLGLSLLRLESTDGELSVQISEKPSEPASAGEAGVNPAGGLAIPKEDELATGLWKVMAFKESLVGAK